MTALVLQARIDSNRLEGKVLLPLGNRPLVFRVMEALAFFPCEKKILACPEDCVSAFAPLAEEAGFVLVPGPKEDVLARYCLAIRKSGADRVIRATADNPFVFVDAAIALQSEAVALGADYAGYFGLPVGAGVESVASEALLRAEREAEAPEEREHVCPYLYRHPEIFRLHRPLAPMRWQGAERRITVDTREDYDRALLLYERLSSLPLEKRNLSETILALCEYLWRSE
jgi:spore coat polysaccharide biosynthesis protein SpsF